MTEVKMVETFKSLLGEGSDAGRPAYFIRLAGCNQRCSYCDTKYSYEPEYTEPVEKVIRDAINSEMKIVQITGGEPLLQAEAVSKMCYEFACKGIHVIIETNGTIDLEPFITAYHYKTPDTIKYVMDVKCPSSGVVNDPILLRKNLEMLRQCDEVKFVMGTKDDFLFAKKWIHGLYLDTNEWKIFLSRPNNILLSTIFSSLSPTELAEWILKDKSLLKYPIRLQLQLHKILWDPEERGV